MINRRTFLCGLMLGIVGAPLAAEAQPARIPRIGYLGNGSPPPALSELWLNRGLRDLGWIEGQTITIEYRWAEGNMDRLPALAADLVQSKVDIIAAAGALGIRAAQRATRTIPIVFVILNNPVDFGLVKSFARPGGNATGMASQFEELITKQLQLCPTTTPNSLHAISKRRRQRRGGSASHR